MNNMNINQKLKLCVVSNIFLLVLLISLLFRFSTNKNPYWNYGPNENLTIISVHINTWNKYYILLGFIVLFRISQVIIDEISGPIIGFNIYNPDKIFITEFSKNELHLYANLMYLINGIRSALLVMITISQVDIALFSVLISQITSIFTIRYLLNEKKFVINSYQNIPSSNKNDLYFIA